MKRSRPLTIITSLTALGFVLAAVWLTVSEVSAVHQTPLVLPPGSEIGGVPVGGLDSSAATTRLASVFLSPIELQYREARLQANPIELGLEIDFDGTLRAALNGSGSSRRNPLALVWARLWNLPPAPGAATPLIARVDEIRLRAYLEETARCYDQSASAPFPLGGVNYYPGRAGWRLDIETALPAVKTALLSPVHRTVALPVQTTAAPVNLSVEVVQLVLETLLKQSGFDGLAAVSLVDLHRSQRVDFAMQNGKNLDPEIAFTAASTIKIPIMLSVLRRTSGEPPRALLDLFDGMLAASENPPADRLMERYLDSVRGPLVVTEDFQGLGLKNTFLAGYFYTGAPLLQRFRTPANSRVDINLKPDIYNQTTPGEMASILEWIYRCAVEDGGRLRETWRDGLTRTECQLVLDTLARNKTALMLEAGVPEATRVAHKHGWTEEADGLLHTMSDVGVIFTPGGDFVLCMYIYHPVQINFDMTNRLVAYLTAAIYNAFNLNAQHPWIFDPPFFISRR